jgi:hypothetical protein
MDETAARRAAEELVARLLAQAVQEERERIATWLQGLAPEFICRGQHDHATSGWAPECIAAALRASSPREPHQHRAACWRDPDGLGIRLTCTPQEVT